MSNMSYCMFANTSDDLDDCLSAYYNGVIESEKEGRRAKRMFIDMAEFLLREGFIDRDGNINEEFIGRMCCNRTKNENDD
jgi:hypothetical protein